MYYIISKNGEKKKKLFYAKLFVISVKFRHFSQQGFLHLQERGNCGVLMGKGGRLRQGKFGIRKFSELGRDISMLWKEGDAFIEPPPNSTLFVVVAIVKFMLLSIKRTRMNVSKVSHC